MPVRRRERRFSLSCARCTVFIKRLRARTRAAARLRNEAHKLIEECMLAANVCAADLLKRHQHPCLYRVHAGPSEEKLASLRRFLGGMGLRLGGGAKPQARDYAA